MQRLCWEFFGRWLNILKNVGHHGCSRKKVLGYTWILLCETRIDLKNIYPKKLLEHIINLGNLGNINKPERARTSHNESRQTTTTQNKPKQAITTHNEPQRATTSTATQNEPKQTTTTHNKPPQASTTHNKPQQAPPNCFV